MMKYLKTLEPLNFVKQTYELLNNISFALYSLFFIVFVLFNVEVFTSTSSQMTALRHTIYGLLILTLIGFSFAQLYNKNNLKKNLMKSKGLVGIFSFFVGFLIFAIIFQSFEGRLDTSFITGVFTSTSFLLIYMFIVSFCEETIFRELIVTIFKSKSKNLSVVYFVSASIFSLYHFFKYNGSFGYLFFAFIVGLGFTALKEKEDIIGLDTYPLAISLHMVYNLYSVGALSIALSSIGF